MHASDNPLPGDVVIHCREERFDRLVTDGYVITIWPDRETIHSGPYQSYAYALQQAQRMNQTRQAHIWRDRAAPGRPELLEDVT